MPNLCQKTVRPNPKLAVIPNDSGRELKPIIISETSKVNWGEVRGWVK